jgi:phenylacetaldehyde dehydrogenase
VSRIAADIRLAPGLDPSCQMGPLVSDEQFRKVVGYIESGISPKARTSPPAALSPASSAATLSAPPCITNTNPGMKVVRRRRSSARWSAPCLFNDDDVEQIVKRANDTIYGLAASGMAPDEDIQSSTRRKHLPQPCRRRLRRLSRRTGA